MKILVVFTGGTIGSSEGKKWISLDQATNYTLIENYKKDNGEDVLFDVCQPYSILSENLSNIELSSLCKLLNKKVKEDYDGIVVTHGTDTIQYTASALAFTVKTDIPIVVVSANYPLENPLTNGNVNFKGAVDFIKDKTSKGVFVAYKNSNSNVVDIHLATNVVGHAEARDDVFSLQENPFAFVEENGSVKKNLENIIYNIDSQNVDFVASPKVLVINSCPADEFNYCLDGYKAVLIKPYHSGTLNTENKALYKFCELANKKDVPVFLANVKSGTAYESSKIYKDLSLTVLPYCSIPAIYTKIWLAISLNKEIKQFVLSPIAGEFIK